MEERILESVRAPSGDEPIRLVSLTDPVLVEHVAQLELVGVNGAFLAEPEGIKVQILGTNQ